MTFQPVSDPYPYDESFLSSDSPLILPEYFRDFKVARPLGRGRYSRVFQVTSPAGTDYALKVTVCSTPHLTNSAIREYALLRRLSGCPHIINAHDFRLEVSPRGLVSAWLLEEYAGVLNVANAHFSSASRLKAAVSVCDALIEGKRRGVAHLDVKPANVFRSRDGKWKLGDFSHAMPVSNLDQVCSAVGSPGYIAPEVLREKRYSELSDIYSMGIFLYRLFTGELPFRPEGPAIPSGAFPKKQLPARLYRVITTAARLVPEDRYPSFEDLRAALAALDSGDLPPDGSISVPRPHVVKDFCPQSMLHTFGDTFSFGEGGSGRYWYAEATWSTLGG